MIKLQPELVLVVVIVSKQTEIREIIQGINREELMLCRWSSGHWSILCV